MTMDDWILLELIIYKYRQQLIGKIRKWESEKRSAQEWVIVGICWWEWVVSCDLSEEPETEKRNDDEWW
jgi:hypothetical protein